MRFEMQGCLKEFARDGAARGFGCKAMAWLGAVLLSITFASSASASCGTNGNRRASALWPQEQLKLSQSQVEAIGTSSPQNGFPDSDKNSIVGLWLATVTIGGQTAYQGFESFSSDGLEVLNDNGSPVEGNVCLGVWRDTGKTIKVNHPSWNYDSGGNLIGTVVIREEVTVDRNANTFDGSITIDVYDLNGNLLSHYAGQITGQRITVD